MNIISKTALTFAAVAGITTALTQPALAFDGNGGGPRSGKNGLIPLEMRQQFRREYADLSDEEQAKLREERQEHRAETETFTGMTREQMREAHRNGESIGDVLASQGKTEADAQAFLTEQANERVETIAARHNLTQQQTQTLRERVTAFVQNMLSRWFGK